MARNKQAKNQQGKSLLVEYQHFFVPSIIGGLAALIFSGSLSLGIIIFIAVWVGIWIGYSYLRSK